MFDNIFGSVPCGLDKDDLRAAGLDSLNRLFPTRNDSEKLKESKNSCKSPCLDCEIEQIQRLLDVMKKHTAELTPNADNRLKTGDVLKTSANGETLTMPNGDILTVSADGTFDLKAKGEKVTSTEFKDGSTLSVLRYPNGDKVFFGTKEGKKRGQIRCIERNKFVLWIELPPER